MKNPLKRYGPANRRPAQTRPNPPFRNRIWPQSPSKTAELATDPHARSPALAQLEAVLFLAAEPLSAEKLSEMLGLPDTVATRSLIQQLRSLYLEESSAFTLDSLAGGYQLRTQPEVTPWLLRLKRMPAYHRLPGTLLETLTVIAYKQPVTRADVEAIRGVACAEAIKLLMGKGLVRTAGRHQSLGRPQLYATTKRFLQYFGMNTIAELPKVLPQ
jgi:segregation and condensation protein B